MKKISVLIVDDSPVERELLTYMAQSDPEIQVIGFASNGQEALDLLQKLTPDVIIMDINMPVMDGFEATRRIMSSRPIPIIICSGLYKSGDDYKNFQALDAGALTILEKPKGVTSPQFPAIVKNFTETIKTVSEIKLITRLFSQALPKQQTTFKYIKKLNSRIEAIAIGASLGGPQALQTILSQLPSSITVPIFIVQHIAEEFTPGLISWLQDSTKIPLMIAKDRDIAKPGNIYFAPGNQHLEVHKNNTMRLFNSTNDRDICPSISRLFFSMATTYGSKGLGVILTGMGRDGVDGLLAMKNTGATTVAQSEDNCVMFGMPREAINLDAVTDIIQLKDISTFLSQAMQIK